jgi:hypothetical protein
LRIDGSGRTFAADFDSEKSFAMLFLDVLPHELPTWLVLLFYAALLGGSLLTGRWLERNDDSQRFENWPPEGAQHH